MAASTAEARSASRPAQEIRFKEIAHYVGLSLIRNPSLTRGVPRGMRAVTDQPRGLMESLPATPSMDPPSDVLRDGDLPSIHEHGKSERLKRELEWLYSEQRAERDHIRKLESCLSDSMLVEKKVRQRIAKHKDMRDLHVQRAADVDKRIRLLREQAEASEGAARRQPKPRELPSQPASREGPSRSGGLEGGPSVNSLATQFSSGSSPGLLMQSASRVGVPQRSSASPGRTVDVGASDYQSSSPMGLSSEAGVSLRQGLDAAAALDSAGPGPAQSGASISSGSGLAQPPGITMLPAPRPRRRRPLTPPPPEPPNPEEEALLREERRLRIREELKERAGGAKEAFKRIDLNGSGSISSQEFADGISRMGVNWQQITGMKRPRDLFNLFDEDKDSAIVFKELFPDEVAAEGGRPSTPEFCKQYFRARNHDLKAASWAPSDREEELKIMFDSSQRNEDAAEKRKWMCSTMRRLKTRGKSDARCREIVALHLPRGTGPKDQEGVNTFSQVDLKNCRKVYNDEVNVPMRRMWKVVGDYKDQRREQRRIYDQLHSVTEALAARQRAEETLNSLTGGVSILSMFKDGDSAGLTGGADKSGGSGAGPTVASHATSRMRAVAHECGMEEGEVEELYKDFVKFADTEEMLGKRGFTRLIQALLPSKTLGDTDGDTWWEQVRADPAHHEAPGNAGDIGGAGEPSSSSGFEGDQKSSTQAMVKRMESSVESGAYQGPGSRRPQCSFEQFCFWWAESEARSS